jgi:hypothetical protein
LKISKKKAILDLRDFEGKKESCDLFGIPKGWFLTSIWLAERQTGFGRRVATDAGLQATSGQQEAGPRA